MPTPRRVRSTGGPRVRSASKPNISKLEALPSLRPTKTASNAILSAADANDNSIGANGGGVGSLLRVCGARGRFCGRASGPACAVYSVPTNSVARAINSAVASRASSIVAPATAIAAYEASFRAHLEASSLSINSPVS